MNLTRFPQFVCAASLLLAPALARAQSTADALAVNPRGDLTIDAGVSAALPAALPTGLSTGIGAGVAWGRSLAIGARASWGTATEYATAWTVTHSDLRLRLAGTLQRCVGRGLFALRLGVGGTLVHETRTRDQGERAGLTGDDLQTTAWRMVPAGDVEAVVSLRITGSWDFVLSGGPSADYFDGAAHLGWIVGLGVAWQP